jgi:putative tricarboxylic transport membrane protein
MGGESKMAGVVAGLLLIITGTLVAWSTSLMRVPPMHAKVGPQVFPYFAAAALAFLGACFIVQSLRNSHEKLAADTEQTEWVSMALIVAGFAIEIALIKPLGFILASSLLFLCISLAFGSRHYVRDIVVALLLSSAAYFTFTKLLNLQLPAGILGGLI